MIAIVGNTTYTWGSNARGQIGQNNVASKTTPTAASVSYHPVPVAAISSSDYAHSSSPGYGGSTFLIVQGTTCYGLFQEDSKVCSSHGVCVAQDQCVCKILYNGPDCSSFNCFGVSNFHTY